MYVLQPLERTLELVSIAFTHLKQAYMHNSTVLIWISLFPSLLSIMHLVLSVQHLYCLGKSNTKLKKNKKQGNVWQRITLQFYFERCEYHIKVAKKLCIIYRGYLILEVLFIIAWFLAEILILVQPFVLFFFHIRTLAFDIPLGFHFFVMTKHDKIHGGITYRWKKE